MYLLKKIGKTLRILLHLVSPKSHLLAVKTEMILYFKNFLSNFEYLAISERNNGIKNFSFYNHVR